MSSMRKAEAWNIDIDRYANQIVLPSQLHRLPIWVSRFLGYRQEQKQDVGNVLGAVWSFLGAFCGLAVVAAVFNHTRAIQMHHPPALIASYVSTPYIS
jgi:ABC-type polysaccharide/polyol phosphate export permease